MSTKALLRKTYLHKRDLLSKTDHETFNIAIVEKLKDLLQKNAVYVIHTFLPQAGKKEIDTWKIIEMLRSNFPSVQLAVPAVIPGTKLMKHYSLTPETRLILNRWLIPEPDPLTSQIIETTMIDAVLIPLLAFDKQGFRVGYGGGFYDRFLPACRPEALKVGLSFFDPVDVIEDKDQYDIPMDYCVTPTEIIRW